MANPSKDFEGHMKVKKELNTENHNGHGCKYNDYISSVSVYSNTTTSVTVLRII